MLDEVFVDISCYHLLFITSYLNTSSKSLFGWASNCNIAHTANSTKLCDQRAWTVEPTHRLRSLGTNELQLLVNPKPFPPSSENWEGSLPFGDPDKHTNLQASNNFETPIVKRNTNVSRCRILGYSLWYLPYPKHRNASFWMGNINASHDAISSPRSFRLHGDWAQHCRTANRQWPSALGSWWMVAPRGKKATQWEQEWLDNTSENDAISSSSFMSTSFHYLDLESFIWTNILCINICIIVCLEHFEMRNTCEWSIKSTDNIISIVTIAMIHIYNYHIYIFVICFSWSIFFSQV